jgi:hypothetical protein
MALAGYVQTSSTPGFDIELIGFIAVARLRTLHPIVSQLWALMGGSLSFD